MKKIGIFLFSFLFVFSSFAQNLPKTPPALKLSDPLPANLFVELGRVINPAVVNISTTTTMRNQMRDPLMDMLEQFYGQQPGRPRANPNRPQQLALGTGFIIREDGLIVTNAHVIRGAENINIQLSEKSDKVYSAKLIGSDDRSDIALIKIKPDGKLPVAVLGNSKDVKVGEWVAAFGNPFGHGHTMTKGIISSIGREIEEINKFPLLQTDASINPGNSGGPLVDSRGLVIGVNSAIDARAQGIGFAIPADEVKKVITELETRGTVRKGYLGVALGDMDPQAAEMYNIKGSVIVRVEANGPAAKAKMKAYDVVTEFNGRKIKSSTELQDAVADAPIGEKVVVKVLRQEGKKFKEYNLGVVVNERPSDNRVAKAAPTPPQVKTLKAPFNIGFSVADLNSDLRSIWGLPEDLKKPLIVDVDDGSLASFVGITAGDVILDINREEVTTAAEVIKGFKKGENSIRLARGNRVIYITLTTK